MSLQAPRSIYYPLTLPRGTAIVKDPELVFQLLNMRHHFPKWKQALREQVEWQRACVEWDKKVRTYRGQFRLNHAAKERRAALARVETKKMRTHAEFRRRKKTALRLLRARVLRIDRRRRQREVGTIRLHTQAMVNKASREVFLQFNNTIRIKKMERFMAEKAASDHMINHGIVVKGKPQDPLEDVRWVFDRFASLMVEGKDGERELNHGLLSQAPSNGAVSMATYAILDPKGFFTRFVIKLIAPVQVESESAVAVEEQQMVVQDPGFADMAAFMQQATGGKE